MVLSLMFRAQIKESINPGLSLESGWVSRVPQAQTIVSGLVLFRTTDILHFMRSCADPLGLSGKCLTADARDIDMRNLPPCASGSLTAGWLGRYCFLARPWRAHELCHRTVDLSSATERADSSVINSRFRCFCPRLVRNRHS
jgi:hypothetical protein